MLHADHQSRERSGHAGLGLVAALLCVWPRTAAPAIAAYLKRSRRGIFTLRIVLWARRFLHRNLIVLDLVVHNPRRGTKRADNTRTGHVQFRIL